MKKILAMVLSLAVLSSGTWVYAASDGVVEDVEEGSGSAAGSDVEECYDVTTYNMKTREYVFESTDPSEIPAYPKNQTKSRSAGKQEEDSFSTTISQGQSIAIAQASPVVGTPKLLEISEADLSKVTLRWKKVPKADGYCVYRKKAGDRWRRLKTLTGNKILTYTDGTASSGTQYFYTVRAYKNVKGKKVQGGYDKKGLGILTGLDTPGLVSARHHYEPGKVKIQWQPVKGAKRYAIYKKIDGRWQRMATVYSQKTTFCYDTKADDSDRNLYTVRAYTNYGKTYKYSGYDKKGIHSDAFTYGSLDMTIISIEPGDILAENEDGVIRFSEKDFQGKISEFQKGDRIRVKFYGSIAEIYPGEIDHVVSIIKIE